MPHVFTLEGPALPPPVWPRHAGFGISGSGMTVTHFPSNGSPLAPAGVPIGPARPETPVFGPGGTPVPYRYRYPARGPVCDYCHPTDIALGDVTDFLNRQSSGAQNALVIGGTLLSGILLGALAIGIRRHVIRQHRPERMW